LTGTWEEGFVSGPMKWGTETEPLGRAEYEIRTGQMVEQVGFINHPKIKMFGGSPDGLVGKDGGIEIKCPNTATHIEALLTGVVDRKYIIQVQSLMAVTGRAWWDFVSFDPRLPAELSYWQTRIMRDDAFIAEIEDEVRGFLAELDDLEKKLRGMMGAVA
jgi:predicted phage-related endonuclease